MNKYVLSVSITGYEQHEVETNSEDEAIELFWNCSTEAISSDFSIRGVYVDSEKEI